MWKFATRFCATPCPSLRKGVAGWLLGTFLLIVAAVPTAESRAATTGPNKDLAHASGSGTIMVIYPEADEPYRGIFAQIVDGISEKAKGRVSIFAVGGNVNTGELNSALRHQNARVVIALGQQGIMATIALADGIDVIAGGVLTATENEARNMQVNILSPDPALMFSRLKEMMPRMRRVFAVYSPRQSAWMMRLAKEAARARGMELEAYEAQDLRSAMRAYQEILAAADYRHDALWLPQDSTTVEESAVLPMVLQESWTRRLAVFSSSFGHAKRGALFSMYPDNVELGRRLGSSALGLLASGAGDASGMAPLRAVQVAVNLRTAKHVGADASRVQGFDMMFPEP